MSASPGGLVIVYTGNGKGKSTAAFGQALRAAGHGLRVCIIQFLKGPWPTGEEKAFTAFPDQVEFLKTGQGFTWESKDLERDRAMALAGWRLAREKVLSGRFDLVILDEITYLANHGVVSEADLLALIHDRPVQVHLLFTGRDAPAALLEAADLATEMRELKHPFTAGAPARKGIEY